MYRHLRNDRAARPVAWSLPIERGNADGHRRHYLFVAQRASRRNKCARRDCQCIGSSRADTTLVQHIVCHTPHSRERRLRLHSGCSGHASLSATSYYLIYVWKLHSFLTPMARMAIRLSAEFAIQALLALSLCCLLNRFTCYNWLLNILSSAAIIQPYSIIALVMTSGRRAPRAAPQPPSTRR